MLRHEAMLTLIHFDSEVMKLKEEFRVLHGLSWKSKQRLAASRLSVEETETIVLSFGEKLKSLQGQDRSCVRRGVFPITDALIDDCEKILREERSDLSGFLQGVAVSRAPSDRRRGTGKRTNSAAASVDTLETTAVADATATALVSRKRSYSVVNEDDAAAKKSRKVPKGAPFLADHPQPPRAFASRDRRDFSSNQIPVLFGAANGSQDPYLQKWQIDKLVDWMKNNDYSSSPSWAAIDELVESTGVMPSQIVACTAELGGRIATLRNEVICIDEDEDEDSVPELADDIDAHGAAFIANDTRGQPALKPHSTEQDEKEAHLFEAENSSLESLVLEFGFEFGSFEFVS
ncbi:hypothetical protein FisN_15Hu303 [Fistulifera solaris]|uniref:Uncharacterized protein n=1 Tax=Fistulifera solaris TaxID=1519565 RepID=A0A1Z5JFP0_FISSO|nr:hypothetical protein FisN_15Hu303 [Fistulifera solaris]|eukprot:GAX12824.1 hypothetical protein FisN_15Hu303 [Fistulifera solaris]